MLNCDNTNDRVPDARSRRRGPRDLYRARARYSGSITDRAPSAGWSMGHADPKATSDHRLVAAAVSPAARADRRRTCRRWGTAWPRRDRARRPATARTQAELGLSALVLSIVTTPDANLGHLSDVYGIAFGGTTAAVSAVDAAVLGVGDGRSPAPSSGNWSPRLRLRRRRVVKIPRRRSGPRPACRTTSSGSTGSRRRARPDASVHPHGAQDGVGDPGFDDSAEGARGHDLGPSAAMRSPSSMPSRGVQHHRGRAVRAGRRHPTTPAGRRSSIACSTRDVRRGGGPFPPAPLLRVRLTRRSGSSRPPRRTRRCLGCSAGSRSTSAASRRSLRTSRPTSRRGRAPASTPGAREKLATSCCPRTT